LSLTSFPTRRSSDLASVLLTFSEEVDPLTITTNSVTLTTGSTTVACAVALSSDIKSVTLTPYTELANGATYTVNITGTVADLFRSEEHTSELQSRGH